jgi:biopolymer transport protein ExbD
MAGGLDLGNTGKGGKKPLDTAINLVPFIDLMAVTISFLIMTAVWTQIGRLQVSQAAGPPETADIEPPTNIPLTLLITDKDVKLTAGGTAYDPMPLIRDSNNQLDLAKLVARLKEVKTQAPDQNTITLQAEDSVKYEDLVRIIDECNGSGLPQVNVSAAMG